MKSTLSCSMAGSAQVLSSCCCQCEVASLGSFWGTESAPMLWHLCQLSLLHTDLEISVTLCPLESGHWGAPVE